eukprot:gene54-650_t
MQLKKRVLLLQKPTPATPLSRIDANNGEKDGEPVMSGEDGIILKRIQFAAKNLERQAKKCEKEEKAEKLKLKRAIQKGNLEGARIHGENSIRQKISITTQNRDNVAESETTEIAISGIFSISQALNYLRMGSRIDAVAQRVQTACTTKQVTQSLAGVVRSMDSAMKSMNLEKMSGLMDKFEKQFEDLDVQTGYMENAMGDTTTLTVPQGQVDNLMQQVADEHGLELNMELPQGEMGSIGQASAATTASQEQDELSARLARLRSDV